MGNRYRFFCGALLAGASGTAFVPPTATAQTAQAAPATGNTTSLDDVVVTAQRRSQRIEDVPIAITVASAQTLENAGIQRLEDISKISPGVQVARTGLYVQPAIRGVTTQLTGVGAENNVAVYIDGFYQPFQRSLNLDLANVRQVSILKGPQGTLFGRNATGGALVVETLQPNLNSLTAHLSLGGGSFNDRQVKAYVSAPLSQTVAFDLNGFYRENHGYIRDVSGFDAAPLEVYSFGGKLLWRPNDALSVVVAADRTFSSDGRGLAVTNDGRSLAQSLFPDEYIEMRRNRTSINFPTVNESQVDAFSLRVEYDLGWGKITSLTRHDDSDGFMKFDSDGSARSVYHFSQVETGKAFTQELNLASQGDTRFSYVAGLYYFQSEAEQRDARVLSYPSTVVVPGAEGRLSAEAYAAYVDLTWQATDRLSLIGGLRYSDETKTWETINRTPEINIEASFDSLTPRAVVRYELTDDSNVYASYSRGFKSGTINIQTPFNVVDPEQLSAYEVGYKKATSRFFFDASAYYYDYQDMQVGSQIVSGGVIVPLISNAASAEIYGAEAQFSGEIADRLNVRAAVAYNHARYDSFPDAPVSLPTPSGLNSGTCLNPNAPPATIPCTQDWSGQPIVRAPEWTFTLGADYTVPLSAGDITLSANVAYSSSYAPTRADKGLEGEQFRYNQAGYALAGVRAEWTLPDANWSFSVFGNNIFDQDFYIVKTGNAFIDYSVQGEPRTWGVRVDYRY